MAGTGRNKPSSGPGRGTPRARTTARPGQNRSAQPQTPDEDDTSRSRIGGGFRLTRRAVILLVVVAALALMYASSLRVYFNHRLQLSEVRAEIAQREASIEKLQDEIKRWEDPEYVKAQARSRLGWVVPGEVGYRVIGPDGKPLGGGVELNKSADPLTGKTWWQRLWGSIEVADTPAGDGATPTPVPSPTS